MNVQIGADGLLLVYALVVSVILAVLSWRRVPRARTAAIVVATGVALALVQYATLDAADGVRQLVRASFIVVPTLVLIGASRVAWLAQRAWLLVLIGPATFVGCYMGICAVCVATDLV